VSSTSLSSSDLSAEEKQQKVQKVSSRRAKKGGRDGSKGQKYGEFRDFQQRDAGLNMLKAPRRLPPLQGTRPVLTDRTNTSALSKNESKKQVDKDWLEEVEVKRTRASVQAHAAACWEDMISFLEVNKLSGAYALGFSAYGINDLPSLLQLDDAALGSLLENCNIDAMDQILLLDAIRSTNPFR